MKAIVIVLIICITVVSVVFIVAVAENENVFNLDYRFRKFEEEMIEIKETLLRIEGKIRITGIGITPELEDDEDE